MAFKDAFNSAMGRAMDKIEKNTAEVERRVRQNLRSYSDDKVRQMIYHAEQERARELAREEADRRGISY